MRTAPHWSGRLIGHVNCHKQDIFVIIVDFHLDRCKARFKRTGAGAVFVAHVLTCLPLNEALLQFNATADGFLMATTSQLQQRYGEPCRLMCGTQLPLSVHESHRGDQTKVGQKLE